MKVKFAIILHFHQPIGNFDHVIESVCNKCYFPFLNLAKNYPEIKMNLHFSGCLLEWFEQKRPDIIDIIKQMVQSKQIELISGAMYEPILISIPDYDAKEQIKRLNNYIKKKFFYEAKGAWIAERVWEPSLASVLYDSNIKYSILDDTHFLYAGLKKEQTYAYYITEDVGKTIAIFPSDKELRYSIPYQHSDHIINYFKSVSANIQNPLFIYADDGEKFGEWPGTYKWVFEDNWLKNFFEKIKQNISWIKTVKLSEYLEENSSNGNIYFPTSSYEEMLQWALPVESQENMEMVLQDIKYMGKEDWYKTFIRGGFWRNFLTKYSEANNMNKKMLYISKNFKNLNIKSNKILEKIRTYILKAQCNCVYWHGVFGGLYLFHLRKAVYYNLIKASVLMDEIIFNKQSFIKYDVLDIDADTLEEVILENKHLLLYVDPKEGGVLKEISSKTICHNFVNTLTRRKEAYHSKILDKIKNKQFVENTDNGVRTIHDNIQVIDSNISDKFYYDKYERYSAIDHIINKDVSIDMFYKCEYNELFENMNKGYNFAITKKNDKVILRMEKDERIYNSDINIIKEISLEKEKIFRI